ncbi:MAG: glycosyltransferase [Chitinophagales bacterium]|nr:glycosyltransferase [Chitinophagaceae bacterium]MCB9064659.1 glycosyltransferase [Chitinophagales bacterium]
MKVSIITVVYNCADTIEGCIKSVLAQDYNDIEYIIVDGGSKDGTVDVVKKYEDKLGKFVSEKDKGIYDAMNKGIKMATGDVIGILNADDFFFSNDTISKIATVFKDDETLDATIADIVFVNDDNTRILRHYQAKKWRPAKFAWGFMPPHPSFFCKKHLFEKLGYYKIDYKIAADYELLIRYLLVNKINYKYLPIKTTRMRMGGVSTRNLNSILTLNKEIKRACRENDLPTNYLKIYTKYVFKPFEFVLNNKQ